MVSFFSFRLGIFELWVGNSVQWAVEDCHTSLYQTYRKGNLAKNLVFFDYSNLKNTYVLLNNQHCPAINYITNLKKSLA